MSQPPYSTNRHLQDVNNDLKAALDKANERIAELEKEVQIKHEQRSDLAQWFEARSVYGELTMEQIDAMSPRQLADHCYERKAEQVEVLTDKLKALTKERDDLKVERDGRTPSARIIELALRLIEAGPKASHVSCSETP